MLKMTVFKTLIGLIHDLYIYNVKLKQSFYMIQSNTVIFQS